MPKSKRSSKSRSVPPVYNWRTTDSEEIQRRQLRAREETFRITNVDKEHPIFSNFRVSSGSGLTYQVEIRAVGERQFSCTCVDFRINGLGTCKHVEAVLLLLQRRHPRLYRAAAKGGSDRGEVVPDRAAGTLRLTGALAAVPPSIRRRFGPDGLFRGEDLEEGLRRLDGAHRSVRLSQEIEPWLEDRRRAAERVMLRREYELKVQSGEWPAHETRVPLFPYQREGMLHLAFVERGLLADEMGLGKTIQAIAACALLHRLGKAARVLVVTPASLKTEWEEQIQRFTDLPYQLVFGSRPKRLRAYAQAPFFTLTNYEQMVVDSLNVNEHLKPDVVVLDEAQRIKNWGTKTAQAVKRLRSRYAFVLTGTPIENRIDEIHSLMDFLNPTVLGPLFRFNRDFYRLDDRGRPTGYCQLDQLHARIRPYLLRRRKADVETELPRRSDRNHFVPLSEGQKTSYAVHEQQVMRLANIAARRPLTQQEQEKLQRELAMMRMICDTNYILDPSDSACPKLGELERVLEDCRENDTKVIVFSEWERMLHLVRALCDRMGLGYAWHTGSVPQKRRRAEINAFKSDTDCRVFMSTDSGATGLNLQTASVVVNCDLPWNPAKLEQRIARAWRKHQTRPVTVVNLVAENTLEHRMLDTLATKQTVAESVLDKPGAVTEIPIRGGRQAFLARLKQLVTPKATTGVPAGSPPPKRPADPARAFAAAAREKINGAMVRCEERYPLEGNHSVILVVVDRDASTWRAGLNTLHGEFFNRDATDPLAPTRLEVIDRATDEALQRLMESGIIAKADRAARPLDQDDDANSPGALSAEEVERLNGLEAQVKRKLKMARLLAAGGLEDEVKSVLMEAAHLTGRALAVRHRLPEPESLSAAMQPPLKFQWKDGGTKLGDFSIGESESNGVIVEYLEEVLAGITKQTTVPSG